MTGRGFISRGDLLRIWQAVPEADREIVQQLFLVQTAPGPKRKGTKDPSRKLDSKSVPLSPPPVVPSHTPPPDSEGRWLLATHARLKQPEPEVVVARPPLSKDDLRATSLEIPPSRPLMRWERVWPYAREVLGETRPLGGVDVARLTRAVARGEIIQRVPVRPKRVWARCAVLVTDVAFRLRPFWPDMVELTAGLRRLRGREGLHEVPLRTGDPRGLLASNWVGCPVWVLGDLGCLAADSALSRSWVEVGRALAARGCSLFALVPCPRHRLRPEITDLWNCSVWDVGERPSMTGAQPMALPAPGTADDPRADVEQKERLLDLLSVLNRCELPLLREIRLLAAEAGASVATEYEIWNHSPILRDLLAVMVRPEEAIRRRAQWRDCANLESHQRLLQRLRDLVKKFHAGYGVSYTCKETINFVLSGALLPKPEYQAALDVQTRLAETAIELFLAGDDAAVRELGLAQYFAADLQVTGPRERREQPGLSKAQAWLDVLTGGALRETPEGLDPAVIRQVRARLEQRRPPGEHWMIRRDATGLILRPSEPGVLGAGIQIGVPLGSIPAAEPGLTLTIGGNERRVRTLSGALRGSEVTRVDLKEVAEIELETQRMTLGLAFVAKPTWAHRIQQDALGTLALGTFHGVEFAFRWVPAGIFTMGSPEGEPGRPENEAPAHSVTISRGFWMGVSPVTTQQWRAVLRDPAHLAEVSPNEAIRGISAREADAFCAALNRSQLGLEARLPTEAEWEYACRAGAESQFMEVSNMEIDLVVKLPKEDSPSRSGIPGLSSLRGLNAWGFTGFHGVVPQWCVDRALRRYAGAVQDPLTAYGTARVLRGSAAKDSPRMQRPTARRLATPGEAGVPAGLRLVLGPLPSSAEQPRPPWALRAGRDAFGQYAEFPVQGVWFRLRWIPPGTFLMGSPLDEAGRWEVEGPQHRVHITRGFWLGETPVTQSQWQMLMRNQPGRPAGPDLPVNQVSWDDVQRFMVQLARACPDLQPRLPTEAEWEHACRAGTTSAFNDGSACTAPEGRDPALAALGWYRWNSGDTIHPVKQLKANAWGLYDMHGNVWEWCRDAAYRWYADGDEFDPVYEKLRARRVVRGGSAWDDAWDCRSACRLARDPGGRDGGVGFRLAAGPAVREGAERRLAEGADAPVPEASAGRRGADRPMS